MLPKPIVAIITTAIITFVLLHQLATNGGPRALVSSKLRWSQPEPLSDPDYDPESVSSPEVSSGTLTNSSLAAIQNDTLGFEKIFVLSLPERTDKRDFMALAAAYSNISLDFRPGIRGEDVPTKALPEGHENRQMGEAPIGSWRGHMNIIREVVERRISTALIMEDDMDWSIHIKSQLPDFARGVHSFYPSNSSSTRKPSPSSPSSSSSSPYGTGWDVLWLGKCTESFLETSSPTRSIYTIENDTTVPLLHTLTHSDGHSILASLSLPNHTRIVHRTESPLCTFAYALSYAGARKILYSLSVAGLAWNFDNALSWWCTDAERKFGQECITVTPTLFSQHRVRSVGVSRNSDNFEEQGWAEEAHTRGGIRESVKMNIEGLIRGDGGGWVDSYPDDAPEPAR